MITKTINTYSGGMAEDLREPIINSFSYASGFDTYSHSNKLTPYRVTETESVDSGTLSTFGMTDVVVMKDAINTNIYALGHSSTDNNPKFFEKSTVMDISASFQACTGGEDTSSNVIPGSLIAFKSKLYAMKTDGSANTYVIDYNHATSTLSSTGTIAAYPNVTSNAQWPKPYVHPKSGQLFFGAGGQMAYYTSSFNTLPTDLLPDYQNLYITSFAEYGSWLAIATAPINGGGSSKVFLWDMVSPNINDVIDFGAGTLSVLENVNGVLVGVMSSFIPTSNTVFNLSTKLIVKTYSGGVPEVIKEITTTSPTFSLQNLKVKNNNRLFFSCKATINGTALNQVWVVGKNKGRWFVSPDRLVNNDTALTGDVTGLSIIGDFMWVSFNSTEFFRTRYASSIYPTAVYESLINPEMDISDRSKKKKLHFISISKATTTGQLVVSVSVDGGAYVTVGTLVSGGKLSLKESRTATGSPFQDGYEFQFKIVSTTGAELTEYKYAYSNIEKNI